jgi:hypothetical protein
MPEAQRDPLAGWSHGTTDDSLRTHGTSFAEKKPLSVSNGGVIRTHEIGFGAGLDVGVERFIKYAPMMVVDGAEDGAHRARCGRVIADMILTGEAEVTVRARAKLDGPERSKTIPLTPTKKQVDTRIQGEQIGFEIRSSDALKWRLGVVRGDISVGSLRG